MPGVVLCTVVSVGFGQSGKTLDELDERDEREERKSEG